MLSSSSLEASSVTEKAALTPSIAKSSEQPATSTSSVSSYRVGTAAMIAPNTTATVEASGDDPGPSTSLAHVLPQHNLSAEDNIHDDPNSTSSFSVTQPFVDGSNNSDSTSASVDFTNSKAVPHARAKVPKKTRGKRLHADLNASSASSNRAAVVPTKKRARSNALTRSAPRATSTNNPSSGLAGKSECMNFTATIFIIQLGSDGAQFHAHESVLKGSPKLAEEIEKAKGNRRATKQNTLSLLPHDAVAFEQMLQFLYKDKFLLSKNKTSPNERLEELGELMSLAKHYGLPALQKQIIKFFSSSKILSKITPCDFFDWAEDMYSEEIDHENGPFKLYFSRVAPMLIKTVDEATKNELKRMVAQGGGFAEQLFIAAVTALDTQTTLTTIKKEEAKDDPTPARTPNTKGKGKEPVPQAAREEPSNVPEDGPTDDSDSLFLRK